MYQRDYILRMVEMLADLIAGIMGLIRKGEFQKASRAIETACYDMLKQDASFFTNIPKENLTETLLKAHNYTNSHLEILSELFYAQAELLFAQGNSGLEFYEKSLILKEFIRINSKTFSEENNSKIDLIKGRITHLKNNIQ